MQEDDFLQSKLTFLSVVVLLSARGLPRGQASVVRRDVKRDKQNETDAEFWENMIVLQLEYHCYNSARLEAVIEALDTGSPNESVPIRKY